MTATIAASFTDADGTSRLACTAHHIAWHARHTPNAAAIVEDGVTVSYRRLAADLIGCVRALEARGIRPGMLAGIETPNRYAHLLILLACEVIGAASVSLTPPEADCDTDMARHCDIVLARQARTETSRTRVIPSGWPEGLAASAGPADDPSSLVREVVPERMARIVRTSGTTGGTKAMALSFALLQLRIARGIARLPGHILPRPRLLCLYGIGVAGMHMRVMSILQLGGTVTFAVGDQARKLIVTGAVNQALFTTGDLERFVPTAEPPPPGQAPHVLVFGAAVSPRLRAEVRRRLHAVIDNPYAAIETDPIAMMGEDGTGTLCQGVEVRIVDGTGQEVGPDEGGTIRARTETMVEGYFDDSGLTATAFIDGWYQTSDIGRMSARHRLEVLGRADEMLNIGGIKLPPAPIAARVKQIDGVSDAIVMSVASPNEVGILLAAVEIGGDQLTVDVAQRIGAILACHIGSFVIMPMRRFPRTDSGKIRRPEIEAAYRRCAPRDLIAVG